MPVYMIRAGEHGPVKIGHSFDPQFRLGQLQISHWETLRIIRLFEGAEIEEAALHQKFADQYIRGEWHHFSQAMLGNVGLVEIIPAQIASGDVEPLAPVFINEDASAMGAKISAHRKRVGLTQSELALAIGIARSTLASIEAGHDMPGRDLLWKLCRQFGLPFIERVA